MVPRCLTCTGLFPPPNRWRICARASQRTLAIGKSGQNVRLAAKVAGWKIDIKSHTQYYGDPDAVEDEDFQPVEMDEATTDFAEEMVEEISQAGDEEIAEESVEEEVVADSEE